MYLPFGVSGVLFISSSFSTFSTLSIDGTRSTFTGDGDKSRFKVKSSFSLSSLIPLNGVSFKIDRRSFFVIDCGVVPLRIGVAGGRRKSKISGLRHLPNVTVLRSFGVLNLKLKNNIF